MKHPIVRLTLAAFLASTALAEAGQHAVPRDSGSSGSGSSPASGGGSSSGSGGGGSTVSSPSGGGDGGGRAVPRHPTSSSSGGGRGGGDGIASGRGHGGGADGSVDRSPNGAPMTSRPQGNRPTTGYAVPRGTVVVPPGRPGGDYYYYPRSYNWYYNPWALGTFGLGFIWDPFWFGPGLGYGYPGYGYGYGYGGDGSGYGAGYGGGYGGGDYGGGYGGGSSGYAGDYHPGDDAGEGALRIKAKPRDARVTVDGRFAGTVDDFDGKFQKLRLDTGPHKVRLEADGFEPLTFDVLIVDGQTVNYKGDLRKH